jgi:predicted ArsR family transcriptional regulator
MADVVAPLGTSALAKKWGVCRKTAWRRLRKLAEVSGARVYSQDGPGRPLRTSVRALNEADRNLVELRKIEIAEIEAAVALRFRVREAALKKTNDELAEQVKALQSQVKSLGDTVEVLLRALQKRANGD